MSIPIFRAVVLVAGLAASHPLAGQSVDLAGMATDVPDVVGKGKANAGADAERRAVLVVSPGDGKAVVEVLTDHCQIIEAVDSASGQPSIAQASIFSPRLDGGKATCILGFPAPDDVPSGKLKVSGIIRAKLANGVRTRQSALCVLRNDAGIRTAGLEFTLKDVTFADAKPRVTLVAREPLSMVKAIRFISGDGKPIPAARTSTAIRQGGFGSYEESWTFVLDAAVNSARLEVDLYSDVQPIDLPFEVLVPIKP